MEVLRTTVHCTQYYIVGNNNVLEAPDRTNCCESRLATREPIFQKIALPLKLVTTLDRRLNEIRHVLRACITDIK